MKIVSVILLVSVTLISSACSTYDSKQSGSDASGQSAPTPSRGGRY